MRGWVGGGADSGGGMGPTAEMRRGRRKRRAATPAAPTAAAPSAAARSGALPTPSAQAHEQEPPLPLAQTQEPPLTPVQDERRRVLMLGWAACGIADIFLIGWGWRAHQPQVVLAALVLLPVAFSLTLILQRPTKHLLDDSVEVASLPAHTNAYASSHVHASTNAPAEG